MTTYRKRDLKRLLVFQKQFKVIGYQILAVDIGNYQVNPMCREIAECEACQLGIIKRIQEQNFPKLLLLEGNTDKMYPEFAEITNRPTSKEIKVI